MDCSKTQKLKRNDVIRVDAVFSCYNYQSSAQKGRIEKVGRDQRGNINNSYRPYGNRRCMD